ncbi:MAG: DUF935 domain-containing protein, partial [Candidatus Sumerlaeota bacterium]
SRSAGFWGAYGETLAAPSHIIRSEGYAGSGANGLFDLYNEMEEKDAHLFAVLQTRKNGILSCTRNVIAASDSEQDRAIARFAQEVLDRIPNFEKCLLHILDAIAKGFSVQEIIWTIDQDKVRIADIKSRAPGRFVFDSEGRLCLHPGEVASRKMQALPQRKFITFTFGDLYENPYGRGLCAHAFWLYWLKKNNLKFWAIFNEKFGAPTIVGKYGPGASEEDRDRLMDVIESLQTDTGITVPESVQLELLEATRAGNISTYEQFACWCNDEISKLVLGATLTAGQGSGSGSYALAKVHEGVRNEYIESDARALEAAINSQLIRWIVDFNFGPEKAAPRWSIDTSRSDNLDAEINIDRQLIALGIPLSRRYFYEKYKRPVPLEDEAVLSHDDQNLFQYHLAHSIVTVNEARERLGLEPVDWGSKPVGEGQKTKMSGGNEAKEKEVEAVMETREA